MVRACQADNFHKWRRSELDLTCFLISAYIVERNERLLLAGKASFYRSTVHLSEG